MISLSPQSFPALFHQLDQLFLSKSSVIHTERWQGADISKSPDMRTHELLNVSLSVPLHCSENLQNYRVRINPNLPWADIHFEERVCGEPLNPPPSYKVWPWGDNAEKFVNDHGQFNHTYPERLWPKFAGMTDRGELKATICDPDHVALQNSILDSLNDFEPAMSLKPPRRGIRWEYGDLRDVVNLLVREPLTRQAWIPLFFPEDTGIGDGGRKPCTLGYQFIVRQGQLHIYYPLRSCDYVRHFRDDIYLAIRLLLWVLGECRRASPFWEDIVPGTYTMHCTSLHIFANDFIQLRKQYETKEIV